MSGLSCLPASFLLTSLEQRSRAVDFMLDLGNGV